MAIMVLTSCSQCGALCIPGRKCEFCDTVIPGSEPASTQYCLPRKKSISEDQYYERLKKIDYLGAFENNAAIVQTDDYYGVVDRDLNFIIPINYDEIINLEGKYFLLRNGDKYHCNIFSVSNLKFITDENGGRVSVYYPDSSMINVNSRESVCWICRSDQLLFEMEGYYYVYNHKIDKTIKIRRIGNSIMRPLGQGFTVFEMPEDLGEFSYRTYQFSNDCAGYGCNGYVTGEGKVLNLHNYRYNDGYLDLERHDGRTFINWQVLDQLGYGPFEFYENSDPEPQFKKMVRFIDDAVEKYTQRMKERKKRIISLVFGFIMLIVILIISILS